MKELLISILLISLTLVAKAQADTVAVDSTYRLRELSVGIKFVTQCENGESSILWDLSHLDSAQTPYKLNLKYRAYADSIASTVIHLDSAKLAKRSPVKLPKPGSYFLESVDSSRKLFFISNELFLDVCTKYQLPDVFQMSTTKYFQPTQNAHISKVEMVIFNSVGDQVFFTKDPKILWDGRNQSTGLACEPGTYFYNCDIYEDLNKGTVKRNLTGIIQLK